MEACKAQAVAARTFAISRGVLKGKAISDASSTAQAYRVKRYDSGAYPHALEGASATAGQILTYKGKPISAVYSANNGGRTVSSAERWGSTYAYLIAQDDPWDAAGGSGKNGHGVGMSQRGAKWAANHGISYREILSFYYPGTEIMLNYGEAVPLSVNEKADAVVQAAESQMGNPYVFGAWGGICTPSYRKQYAGYNPQYKEKIYGACPVLSGKQSTCDGCKWKGKRAFDCRGYTHWCLLQAGIDISGSGATSQYNNNANWEKKGPISEMPDLVCCVFKDKNGTKSHTGLHIGKGDIDHCSGTVKRGKITDKGWTHYALPKGLYTTTAISDSEEVKIVIILKRGSKGQAVSALQEMLNKLGFDCGTVDGIFGTKTEAAVRSFQAAQGLTVDGIAGEMTQNALAVACAVVPPETGESGPVEAPAVQGEQITVALDQDTATTVYLALKKALGV